MHFYYPDFRTSRRKSWEYSTQTDTLVWSQIQTSLVQLRIDLHQNEPRMRMGGISFNKLLVKEMRYETDLGVAGSHEGVGVS